MGSVHVEQVNEGRGTQEWYRISFTDITTIKYLITHRSELDEFYEAKMYESHSIFVPNAVPIFKEPVEVAYMDLERLIKNAKLNDYQTYIIHRLMKGYTFGDIADELNQKAKTKKISRKAQTISRAFDTICFKIKEENDNEWKNWLETSGTKKIDDNITYKQCTKCGRWLRADEDNFYYDKTNNRLKSRCKRCEN